ncbi:MAG: Gfo/Idh/MocA family oxidoreductase [Bacteroidia bacterium]|nr:Gfo/Idh/MocA family oxidoreductase [Bacteroidia bacterium]
MDRRKFIKSSVSTGVALGVSPYLLQIQAMDITEKSIGVIGLDTSHSVAFSKIINQATGDSPLAGFRVTHAYSQGSMDIESSVSRIPGYTEEIKKLGVVVESSLESMLEKVDFVLLETNDGRPHLAQAMKVFEAGKPVFIDKPVAASLEDVVEIYKAAEKYKVPVFSSSSLRYSPTTQEAASGKKIGEILGADTFSPAKLEPTHPDFYWYGIHGIESLFTLMGKGCVQVRRISTEGMDVVIGEWADGKIGTFRGIRDGHQGYGGTAYGTTGVSPAGLYEGYEHLVIEIIRFFKTGVPPVSKAETLEIYAFMTAADVSKRKGGKPVNIADVLKKAGG